MRGDAGDVALDPIGSLEPIQPLASSRPLEPHPRAAAVLDDLIRRVGCDGGKGTLLAALLLIGCVNGWIAQAMEAWHADGAEAVMQIFGISPFELVVAGIGCALVASGRGVRAAALGPAALLFTLAVALPSGLASWGAVLAYGLWVGFSCRDAVRCGGMLIAGLAACAIWWAAGEKLLGELPLTADAVIASQILALLVAGATHAGNVVSNPSGHGIVVLTTCSTTHGLPIALVSMAALTVRNRERTVGARRLAVAVAGLAATYFAANIIRLVILAWSPAAYAVGHGSWGLAAFDTLATGLTLGIAALARGVP